MDLRNHIWIINKAEKDFEKTDTTLKKHLIFKPFVPQQLPLAIALRYIKQYQTLSICNNPKDFFKDKKLSQLVIRDAGIGDLLLLEPILRQLVINGERQISILSRYPEVYEGNPYITENLKQIQRDVIPVKVQLKDYDAYEDLRGYSETCQNRDKIHRTDCYNQVFNVKLSDPEPRIYFKKDEKPFLKREKDKIYIGLACDGSHSFRRYYYGKQLIDYLLSIDPNFVVVLFGTWDFVKPRINERIIDLQNKTEIRDAINVCKDLDYLISVDTGLMHVALSMHIPTVCIFSIIKPELRVKYYKGSKEIVFKEESCGKIGCGSYHMAVCRHQTGVKDPSFVAPCLDITPEEIASKLILLKPVEKKRLFYSDEKIVIKKVEETATKKEIVTPGATKTLKPVNIIPHSTKHKLTMPIIVQNEEINLPRFIENVINHPMIGRVIAIDGGSTDKTVELLKKAGAEVYKHPYIKSYHEQQAMQRNISFSYVKNGEKCIYMDVDECFSRELSNWLPEFAESNITYGLLSRRTFHFYKDIHDLDKQILDYPDFQPRLYTWDRKFKFVGGAHHITLNVPPHVNVQRDIVHFHSEGKEKGKREKLEGQWKSMMVNVRKYA